AARQPWPGTPLIWLCLAMTDHRLGRPERVEPWLTKAEEWLDAELARPEGNDRFTLPQPWWHDWLALQLLYREAVELVRGPGRSLGRSPGRIRPIHGHPPPSIPDALVRARRTPGHGREPGRVPPSLRRDGPTVRKDALRRDVGLNDPRLPARSRDGRTGGAG